MKLVISGKARIVYLTQPSDTIRCYRCPYGHQGPEHQYYFCDILNELFCARCQMGGHGCGQLLNDKNKFHNDWLVTEIRDERLKA